MVSWNAYQRGNRLWRNTGTFYRVNVRPFALVLPRFLTLSLPPSAGSSSSVIPVVLLLSGDSDRVKAMPLPVWVARWKTCFFLCCCCSTVIFAGKIQPQWQAGNGLVKARLYRDKSAASFFSGHYTVQIVVYFEWKHEAKNVSTSSLSKSKKVFKKYSIE